MGIVALRLSLHAAKSNAAPDRRAIVSTGVHNIREPGTCCEKCTILAQIRFRPGLARTRILASPDRALHQIVKKSRD